MTRLFPLLAVCALLLTASGCGGGCGGDSGNSRNDAGPDGACAAADGGAGKANGQTCGCAKDCQSGFCVDGVCCNSACTETCKTCNDTSAPGICSFVASGAMEPSGACAATAVSTCGLDGTCDGQGHCRKYPPGTVCKPGSCDGAAISDVNVCDDQGRCRSGPATVCAPYNCDPATNKCETTCLSNADCAGGGVLCVNGSCGLKPNGAVCGLDNECKSGFCTDGLCCNVACRGACVSCDQQGRGGTCFPIDAGAADPHKVCLAQTAQTCGTTGACDGIGGCARFAPQTICIMPACSGDRLNTAGTCNGLGSCLAPGMQNCDPFRCANNACINRCSSNADCIAGHACLNGSCGKKANGQPCAATDECASNHCVDNVCCDQACGGACRSCALQTALGICTPVPNGGDDTRRMCATDPASTCGFDGKCNGAGGCRRYLPGTVCAAEHCENNKYTPASACSTTGTCVAPDAMTCVPFACNGSKCFGACTSDANCSIGNVCVGNSCGKKPNGAFCSAGTECVSGTCAQGICCATACTSACKSCALAGAMGSCTNVPANSPDPSMICVDRPGTCNTNGKCAAGACQLYAPGTACADASCPAGGVTLTPASACDGAGVCVTPAQSSCVPFKCGMAACISICTADADCASPNVCNNGSCGRRPIGASCAAPDDCQSLFCAQGICCATACTGSCMSCALIGTLGTCKPIAADGMDPKGQCTTQGTAGCGMTGFCDGAGGCQLYAAGTQCAPPSCPMGTTTATLARTCDGAGTCRTATTQSCGSYACNGTTCNAACGGDGDCAPGNVCNNGACGLKRLGQQCGGPSECDSGNCIEGVCCSSGVCGNCQSCNVAGLAGACHPVIADDMEPHGGCAPNPPCGFNGKCDGNGACRNAAATTSCGTASCTGSTATAVGNCNGVGGCVQPPMSCAPFACGTTSCRTSCTGDGECASGFTCMVGTCTNLKANGAACVAGTDCFSGNCTEGFCCAAASCGSCNSCAVTNMQGTCLPLPMGTSCGVTTCAASMLTVLTCNGGGQCAPQVTDCTPYACDGSSACKVSCADPADCAPTFVCTAPTCGP